MADNIKPGSGTPNAGGRQDAGAPSSRRLPSPSIGRGAGGEGLRLARIIAVALLLPLILSLSKDARPAEAIVSCQGTFTTAGETPCQIPAGALTIAITAVGGAGGLGRQASSGTPGKADQVQATVPLPLNGVGPGGTLYVEVAGNGGNRVFSGTGQGGGAGGANGGAGGGNDFNYSGGGGGGASDVRTCAAATCTLSGSDTRQVVAGGGGGASSGFPGVGGNGGNAGTAGTAGVSGGVFCATAGQGGQSTAGSFLGGAGSSGVSPCLPGGNGSNGSLGNGGPGGGPGAGTGNNPGGGGGGGYFGGGGGGGGALADGGGGGGGSDFVTSGATSSTTTPSVSASPSVTISFTIAPPTFSKAFGTPSITVGGTTSLTFTIPNPNSSTSLTGVSFTDALPVGLAVATPNGLTGSCGGGAISAVATSSLISLSGATLAANSSCTFSVNVTADTTGTKVNETDPISSNESGTGGTASATLTVNTAGTSISLTSAPNPSTPGQGVTFTASVTCIVTPTGTVTFNDAATPIATVTAVNGVASFSTTSLTVGSHSITAVYNADGNCATSTSNTVTQTVNPAMTITLTSSVNPSMAGQPVTFTATFPICGPAQPGNAGFGCLGICAAPTGSVTFKDGAVTLGNAPISGLSASFTSSALAVGSHPISATYPGDANCAQNSSNVLSQVVNQTGAGTTLASSTNPSAPGQPVTFTATVTCSVFTPTGTVTFFDGSTPLGTVSLPAVAQPPATGATPPPVASLATSALAPGSHNITATYNGNTNCAASTSAVLVQVVGTAGGALTLASSLNPSAVGQAVTFTATVTCPGFTPTGTVTFTVDGTAGTPVTLNGGTATFMTSSLTAGSHSVSAAYSGDGNCGSAASSVLTQVVNAAPTQPTEQPAVGLSYCYPAVNAPPPGVPCTPFTGNGPLPTGSGGVISYCQAVWPLLAQQQACIAQALGNVGGFICPIGCAHPSVGAASPTGSAGILPARLPGAYCTNPDGSRQWVPQGAPAPARCT